MAPGPSCLPCHFYESEIEKCIWIGWCDSECVVELRNRFFGISKIPVGCCHVGSDRSVSGPQLKCAVVEVDCGGILLGVVVKIADADEGG